MEGRPRRAAGRKKEHTRKRRKELAAEYRHVKYLHDQPRALRTLESHNDRDLKAELFGRGNDSLSDDVTAHDATEDVHQHCVHLWAKKQHVLGQLLVQHSATYWGV